MNESALLRISLAVSLIGILLLFFISIGVEINNTSIEKINGEKINGDIAIEGIVKSITNYEKYSVIVLSQETEIEAIAYENLDLQKGDKIKILGEVTDYEDKKQVRINIIEVKK